MATSGAPIILFVESKHLLAHFNMAEPFYQCPSSSDSVSFIYSSFKEGFRLFSLKKYYPSLEGLGFGSFLACPSTKGLLESSSNLS